VNDPPRQRARWPRTPFRPISRGAARAVVVLFIIAFLLAAGSFWLSVRTVQGQIANRASVVQLCQAGNDSRAQQVTLWTHLAAISAPPPHETAAQRARREKLTAQLIGYVRQVFRARDCTG